MEILPFVSTYVDLESIMLSEMSDRERQILHILIYMQPAGFRCIQHNDLTFVYLIK